MKDKTIFIIIVLSFLFLFTTLFLKAAHSEKKIPTCNFHKASQEFADYIQKELQDNPAKHKEINKNFQILANEIMLLNQQGKIEEICIKYTQFIMATK